MNLGNRIRRIRKEKRLTGADVCKGIISPSHYSNIENGRYSPPADTILLLAERLAVPVTYLENIYEEDILLAELLKVLNLKIEKGDIKGTNQYFKKNEQYFKFIPSITQEFHFSLLLFTALVKADKIQQSKDLYSSKIASYHFDSFKLDRILLHKYYYVSGLYHYFKEEYNESISYFKKVLEREDIPLVRARISYNISLALYNLRLYPDALIFAENTTTLYLRLHKWDKTGNCYNLIATILRESKKLDESEEYINKGFNIAEERFIGLHAKLYHNLALINKDRKELSIALENVINSINLKQAGDLPDIFLSYRLQLDILLSQQDIVKLKKTLTISLDYIKSEKDKAYYLYYQSQMHYLLEDYILYEKSIKKSLHIFLKEKDWRGLQLSSEHYSNFLEQSMKYKKALEYQKICLLAFKNIYREM